MIFPEIYRQQWVILLTKFVLARWMSQYAYILNSRERD